MTRLRPLSTSGAVPLPFAWGCVVRDHYHFTYIYGAAPACTLAVVALPAGEYLPKGGCNTLVEARTRAQEAAAQLQEVYAGVGSSRAVPVGAFAREREREPGQRAVRTLPRPAPTAPVGVSRPAGLAAKRRLGPAAGAEPGTTGQAA